MRRFVLCWLLIGTGSAFAAAPEVTHLYPAGGVRGGTVSVAVAGKLGTRPVQVWCDRDDVQVSVPEKGSSISVTIGPDARPGLCWLRLYNSEGASSLKPFVIGTLPEVLEKEPNDKLSAAHSLETSSVVLNGVLAKTGDVDVFAVPLRKGDTVVVSMEANRTLGSPMDGILQFVSPEGFVLEQNDDDRGVDPQLVHVVEKDGTYFVRAFAFPIKPNSSVRLAGAAGYVYRLTVTTGAFVNHSVPLAVTRGKGGTISLFGWNLPNELKQLNIDAKTGQPFVVVHHPRLANQLPVLIEPHSTGAEVEPNDSKHPQLIELPTTITGRIDRPGDADTFRFRGVKGQKWEFRVASRSLGYPLDPVLKLVGAGEKLLKRVDDPSRDVFDPVLAYTIPSDGEYRLEVTDLYGHGGFRYAYRMRATVPQPDFGLSLSTDAFTLTPGKPLEIPVAVARQNGFAEEIDVTVTGLPKGVTAKPIKSLPKGATSKSIKLVLEATEGQPVGGLIHVIGRSAAKPDLERTAQAPIPNVTAKTANLWLTVLKPKANAKK